MTISAPDAPLTRRGLFDVLGALFGGDKSAVDETAFKSVGDHWFARWSNNFQDRDEEIFTSKAIDDYVTRVDSGRVPPPELWVWHAGASVRVGQAEWVGRHEHFLIASGIWDETARAERAKAYYAAHPGKTSLSHGFTFNPTLFDGKHYHAFNTFEISLLPRGKEANRFTSLERIKTMTLNDDKRKYLADVFGEDEAAAILADLEKKGKALEALDVAFKDFTGSEPPTQEAEKAAADSATKGVQTLVGELVSDLAATIEMTKAVTEAVGGRLKAQDEKLTAQQGVIDTLQKAFDERPTPASQSDDTVLTPERVKEMIERATKQETVKDSFWGTETTEA